MKGKGKPKGGRRSSRSGGTLDGIEPGSVEHFGVENFERMAQYEKQLPVKDPLIVRS